MKSCGQLFASHGVTCHHFFNSQRDYGISKKALEERMIQLEFNRKKNCRLKDILSQKKGGEGMGERKKKEEKMDSQNRWTGADTL